MVHTPQPMRIEFDPDNVKTRAMDPSAWANDTAVCPPYQATCFSLPFGIPHLAIRRLVHMNPKKASVPHVCFRERGEGSVGAYLQDPSPSYSSRRSSGGAALAMRLYSTRNRDIGYPAQR